MNKNLIIFVAFATLALTSCQKSLVVEKPIYPEIQYDTTVTVSNAGEKIFQYEDVIICNEGSWQSDNGQLSLYSGAANMVKNQWFQGVNNFKLGDTPNDIIQVNDTTYAIAVNWSNVIQFIRPDGTSCGYTEGIPNNRKMCIDDKGNLYVTSYAHECNGKTFTKGFVAKIDTSDPSHPIIGTAEVGYEPEGVKFYNGKLYVANSGGYSYSESHDYEHTVSVVDAETMVLLENVELFNYASQPVVNLYGTMSQVGKYLCINSPGNYMDIPAQSVIFNCEDNSYTVLDFPTTYSTADDKVFYTVGASFSYVTYDYEYYIYTIDPESMNIVDGIVSPEVTEYIASLVAPYDIYVSPYTSRIYMTDAKSYSGAGTVSVADSKGFILKDAKTYICPAHMVAVPHYNISTTTTTQIVVTPHITYPTTKSSVQMSMNDKHREYFLECWRKAHK